MAVHPSPSAIHSLQCRTDRPRALVPECLGTSLEMDAQRIYPGYKACRWAANKKTRGVEYVASNKLRIGTNLESAQHQGHLLINQSGLQAERCRRSGQNGSLIFTLSTFLERGSQEACRHVENAGHRFPSISSTAVLPALRPPPRKSVPRCQVAAGRRPIATACKCTKNFFLRDVPSTTFIGNVLALRSSVKARRFTVWLCVDRCAEVKTAQPCSSPDG